MGNANNWKERNTGKTLEEMGIAYVRVFITYIFTFFSTLSEPQIIQIVILIDRSTLKWKGCSRKKTWCTIPVAGAGSVQSIYWLGYRQSVSGPNLGRDKRSLSSLETVRLALGPTQPPVQWIPAFFPGDKAGEAWIKSLTSIWSRD